MMPIPWEFLRENLVTQSEIARRVELTRTTPTTWSKYDDWPAPVMTFPGHSSTGEMAFYWWPDVQAFLGRHGYRPGKGLHIPGRPPKPRPRAVADDGQELVTRSQIAGRRDVDLSTVMSWIDRYPDFPAPADTSGPQPKWSWPAVEAYLDAKGLPKWRDPGAAQAGQERDARILATLGLYPEGLTEWELADLLAEDEQPARKRPAPTRLAVRVRIEARLRILKEAGKVTTATRPDARRGVTIWQLSRLPLPACRFYRVGWQHTTTQGGHDTMDVDRTPALVDQADPDGEALADEQGWDDLAARFDGLDGIGFIRLPEPDRRAAVQSRRAS